METVNTESHESKLLKAFERSADHRGKYYCLIFATGMLLGLAGLFFSSWNLYQATEYIQISGFIVLIIVCLFSIFIFGILFAFFFDSIANIQLSMEKRGQDILSHP